MDDCTNLPQIGWLNVTHAYSLAQQKFQIFFYFRVVIRLPSCLGKPKFCGSICPQKTLLLLIL